MALNFPASPTLNEVFITSGVSYIWDGVKWTSRGNASGQPLVPDENGNVTITGNLIVQGSSVDLSGNLIVQGPSVDLSGNLNVAGDIDND